jgi:hypothetical protein
VPHQVDGSALGTSGRRDGSPASGQRARRRLARARCVGVGDGAAQLADQPGQRQRPGRPALDLLDRDAELVEEPRRLLAVVLGEATAVTTRRSRARVQAT